MRLRSQGAQSRSGFETTRVPYFGPKAKETNHIFPLSLGTTQQISDADAPPTPNARHPPVNFIFPAPLLVFEASTSPELAPFFVFAFWGPFAFHYPGIFNVYFAGVLSPAKITEVTRRFFRCEEDEVVELIGKPEPRRGVW